MIEHPKVFISYKWQDERHNSWVEKLYVDLRMKFGIDAQLDKYEVDFGDSFSNYMMSRINHDCEALLFIITPKSVDAVDMNQQGGLAFEMQIANARRLREKSFKIIGIYREGDKNSGYLHDHRYIDFRDDTKYDYNLNILATSLLGKRKKPFLNKKIPKIHSPKLKAKDKLRNEELALFNKVADLGVKWAEERAKPNIIEELQRPIPGYDGYWWRNIWSSITSYSDEIQSSFVQRIFEPFSNYSTIIELCNKMISFNRANIVTNTIEIEKLAKDYMWRLLEWGGDLREIHWLSEDDIQSITLDGSFSHKAMDASHKIAKKAGREAEWYLLRGGFREFSNNLFRSNSNDFANQGSWLVVKDLMTELDPFEIEIELFFKGVTRTGYGLEPPHKDYFCIGIAETNP